MNKPQYLAELDNLLIFMTRSDREQALARFGALFDAAGPAGQDALLEKLGSATRQAIRLSRIYDSAGYEDELLDELELDTELLSEQAPSPAPEPEDTPPAALHVPEEQLPEYDLEDLPDLTDLPDAPEPGQTPAPADEDDDFSDEEEDDLLDDEDFSDEEDEDLLDDEEDDLLDEDLLDEEDEDIPADENKDVPAGEDADVPTDESEAAPASEDEAAPDSAAPEAVTSELEPETPAEPASEEEPAPQAEAEPEAPAAAEDTSDESAEPSAEDEEEEEDDGVPLQGPVILIERTMPLGVGIPLFILSVLVLAIPLAAVLVVLFPAFLLPGLALLLGAWLAVVGGLWCISIIADAAMLFGLALILLAAGLVVLWLGLWLFVLLVKGYAWAMRGISHLTLGKKVTEGA